MSFNVIATPKFKKELKSLAKKYPSLKADFSELIALLEINP
jgi:mRNA-degrading endonuclease RelE of RelBE toxin-antitoxin system